MNETRSPSEQARTLGIAALMQGRLALTPATVVLVGMNLAIFAVMLVYGAGFWHSPNDIQLAWGASFGPATKDGEWWRLGTAMFLHFGLIHLALNMWALWDGGRLVERLYGSASFVVTFLASGLTGNLLSLIVQGDHAVSGGASGAIFGIYGALLVWLWRERDQIHPTEFRWIFGGAAVFSAATIGFGLLIPGIDNAAHIGGLISGALIGTALANHRTGAAPGSVHHRLAAAIYLFAVAGLFANVPAPSYRWSEEVRAREEVRQFIETDQRISRRWREILASGRQEGASFDELAGRIEADITLEYQKSFDQLSAVNPESSAPSTITLEVLKKYAQLRSEASHWLAEGLRLHDEQRIREALEMARRAPYQARGMERPVTPGTQ